MIYLGYQDRPAPDDPSRDYGPGSRPNLNAHPVQLQAESVRDLIKLFLRKLAHWEATYLHDPGVIGRETQAERVLQDTILGGVVLFSPAYINAEADAVSIEIENTSDGRPTRFRLKCDMERARRNRRGASRQMFDVSWVFFRLHNLSVLDSFAVYIWDVNIPDGARAAGQTLIEPENTPYRIVLVDGWVWAEESRQLLRRADLARSEVVVHETVIHAYRDAHTLSSPVPPGNFLWGHHTNYPFHSLITTDTPD